MRTCLMENKWVSVLSISVKGRLILLRTSEWYSLFIFHFTHWEFFEVILISHHGMSILWADKWNFSFWVTNMKSHICIWYQELPSTRYKRHWASLSNWIWSCVCPPLARMNATNETLILAQLIGDILHLPLQVRWLKEWKED